MRVPFFIRPAADASFRALCASLIAASRKQYRYVFVLGHMRSGSSLLTHLITSHSTAAGYAETNFAYSTPGDFRHLAPAICRYLHRPYIFEPILVDQINHNHMLSDQAALGLERAVIISRSERDSLDSIVRMFSWSEQKARDYYSRRLSRLRELETLLGPKALRISYEELTGEQDATLAKLSTFLKFDPPLTSTYEIKRTTGKLSDDSANIHIGRILHRPEFGRLSDRHTDTGHRRAASGMPPPLSPDAP